jgi:hypothetical protein
MGCYLIAKLIMNYSQNRKNLKGFLGWSGFTLAVLGIALMLTGSTMSGTHVQWLGVIVGGIASVLLVGCSFTNVYKPKKIVHQLYTPYEQYKMDMEIEEGSDKEKLMDRFHAKYSPIKGTEI